MAHRRQSGDTPDMADLILIAVSLTLAAYYVIRIFRFFPAAEQSKKRDGRLK